eukprot:gb/GEZJ01005904.1/.p2 GENE.gb/GEZJ01005904.1/~~gb/GEZJ01005904.1/.p2  ORF type:complete len:296 (-),score=34.92 gb/GEZJ01005904.1/:329-1216(-)
MPRRAIVRRAQEEEVDEIEPVQETLLGDKPECTDEMLFDFTKPLLIKVCAPFRKQIQVVDETIARRTVYVSQLMKHAEEDTIPKSIVVPRMPQLQSAQIDKYSSQFKQLSENFAKQFLKLLIQAKLDEVRELKKSRRKLLEEAFESLEEALTEGLICLSYVTNEQTKNLCERFKEMFVSSLNDKKIQATIASGLGSYIKNTKKKADLLKKSAQSADEEGAPEGVDQTRKELAALRNRISVLESSRKNNPPKAPKAPNKQKPLKGRAKAAGKSSVKPNPKPKNGKAGAAGRGARQN